MKERLYCDIRSGCVAIYPESRKNEKNGCSSCDDRNIAYSSKGSVYNNGFWTMDSDIQKIYRDMVEAYNKQLESDCKEEEGQRISDKARNFFKESGLTYTQVFYYLPILKAEIQEALDRNAKEFGSLEMKLDREYYVRAKKETNEVECFFLKVSGPYFSQREAVSFNADGFIGFSGWASTMNTKPFVEGFIKGIKEIKKVLDICEKL